MVSIHLRYDSKPPSFHYLHKWSYKAVIKFENIKCSIFQNENLKLAWAHNGWNLSQIWQFPVQSFKIMTPPSSDRNFPMACMSCLYYSSTFMLRNLLLLYKVDVWLKQSVSCRGVNSFSWYWKNCIKIETLVQFSHTIRIMNWHVGKRQDMFWFKSCFQNRIQAEDIVLIIDCSEKIPKCTCPISHRTHSVQKYTHFCSECCIVGYETDASYLS